ncbi:hypothetical protein R3P38DRAFT_3172233 [Favolaschia claudopus]|uniref:F-box domain-containing protein n=1 Tax=Favolaschia claudopus TaxID=2862362 RepID=A0AAW0DMD0_9AGAR
MLPAGRPSTHDTLCNCDPVLPPVPLRSSMPPFSPLHPDHPPPFHLHRFHLHLLFLYTTWLSLNALLVALVVKLVDGPFRPRPLLSALDLRYWPFASPSLPNTCMHQAPSVFFSSIPQSSKRFLTTPSLVHLRIHTLLILHIHGYRLTSVLDLPAPLVFSSSSACYPHMYLMPRGVILPTFPVSFSHPHIPGPVPNPATYPHIRYTDRHYTHDWPSIPTYLLVPLSPTPTLALPLLVLRALVVTLILTPLPTHTHITPHYHILTIPSQSIPRYTRTRHILLDSYRTNPAHPYLTAVADFEEVCYFANGSLPAEALVKSNRVGRVSRIKSRSMSMSRGVWARGRLARERGGAMGLLVARADRGVGLGRGMVTVVALISTTKRWCASVGAIWMQDDVSDVCWTTDEWFPHLCSFDGVRRINACTCVSEIDTVRRKSYLRVCTYKELDHGIQMELFDIQNPGIYDRLRHNKLPSDSEKRAIQDSIHAAKVHLLFLEIEAPPISPQGGETEIRALTKHIVQSCAPAHYITQYSSLLSPIRRLPVDILRMIFLDPAIHEPGRVPPSESYYSILRQYKPNRLGAVCYHWRCVTLEMATLWSGITVFLNQPSRYSIDGLRLALQRSQNTMLNIAFRTVNSRGFKFEPWSPLDNEMMLEVLQHTERWAVVDLPLEADFLFQLSPAQGTEFFVAATAVLSIAPRLRTLTIRGWAYKNMLPSLPWCQAQDLRDLSLHICHVRAADYVAIVSPHLENFFLFGPSYDNAHEIEILHRITAPALNHFHVVNLKFWDTPPMLGFIKRSGFSLQTLVFYRVPVRGIDLIPILRAVPTVQNLLLEDLIPNAITNSVMEALTANPATPAETALPAMSTFVLVGAYLFGQGNLLTMLESRLTLPNLLSPLINVEISLPNPPMSPVALQRLDAMRLATTSFRFTGIDQNQRTAVVKHGDNAPHIASIRDQGLEAKQRESFFSGASSRN